MSPFHQSAGKCSARDSDLCFGAEEACFFTGILRNTGLAHGSFWVLLPLTQAPVRPRKWAKLLQPAQLPAPGATAGHSCYVIAWTLS